MEMLFYLLVFVLFTPSATDDPIAKWLWVIVGLSILYVLRTT